LLQTSEAPLGGTASILSPRVGAIRYAFNQWDGLVRILADGRIELDTNSVERSMRTD
jgi:hypothetical protein